MSATRRKVYKLGDWTGTAEAAARGPAPLARRLVRRQVYKRGGRSLYRALKSMGLGR